MKARGTKMINYAHRGASEVAPENTMSAFCIGLFMGANGIETDVRRTSDGNLVLFHDANMSRITGVDAGIESMTYDDLLKLDFGAYKNSLFKGEKIVLFEDFLRYFRDKDIEFAVELKGSGIEKDTIEMLYRYSVADKSIVTGFKSEDLRQVRSFDNRIRLGYLTDKISDETLDWLESLGIKQICPNAKTIDIDSVRATQERGFSVRAWGVETNELMIHAVTCGVDGMTVNFPDRLKDYMRGRY
jgi:glycerophosphoryl diester phosphodiesterase